MIILVTSVLNLRNGRAEIFATLNQFLPSDSSTLIRDSLTTVVPRRNPYSILSVVGLLFGASRLFTNLQRSMSRIFGDVQPRRWYAQILVGLVMLCALGGLALLSSFLAAMVRLISFDLKAPRSLMLTVGPPLTLLFIGLLTFALLFRYVPRR